MIAEPPASQHEATLRHSFISEVFHNLSQPLTALHCSLELALDRDTSLEQLRASVQTALESAERLRQRLMLVRAISEATDPGDLSQPTNLIELLEDLRDDMLPVFASAGVNLEVQTGKASVWVRGNRCRLQRAVFCFLEYLLRYADESGTVAICVAASGSHATMKISCPGFLPVGGSPHCAEPEPYSCELEMARRTFHAAGGEFALATYRPDATVWHATLNRI